MKYNKLYKNQQHSKIMAKKDDAYEKFAGDFKNEPDFEEELEEEDLDPAEEEREHFEDE